MHSKTLSTITVLLLPSLIIGTCPSNDSAEERLANYLTARYAYFRDVIVPLGTPLQFFITFCPILIVSLEEKTQKFHTSTKFVINWKDERLSWDSFDYAGILEVHVGMKNMWRPDFIIKNVVDMPSFYIGSDNDIVRLTHEGDLEWSPTGSFRTVCKVNVVRFPFDTQRCTIVLTSWMADTSKVNLTLNDPSVNYHSFIESGEWDLSNVESLSSDSYEPEGAGNYTFRSLQYTYHLKRRSTFYVVSILLPVLLLSLMNAMVFVLPAESGERLSMSMTSMLSLTVFLGYIGDTTPANTEHIPHVAIFVLFNLIVGAVSMLFNIVVLNVHFSRVASKRDADPDAESKTDTDEVDTIEVSGACSTTASLCSIEAEQALRPRVNSTRVASVTPSVGNDITEPGRKATAYVLRLLTVPAMVKLLDKAFFTVMLVITCVGTLACFLAMLM